MKIKNRRLWDGYVKANVEEGPAEVIKFAEIWANAMEKGLVGKNTVLDVAEPAVVAVLHNLTGSNEEKALALREAIKVLYDVWEYGAPLRVWYENELNRVN